MFRLHSSSQQQPRSGAPLRGLPLATVVTLSGAALLLGRGGPGAGGDPAYGPGAGIVMTAAADQVRPADRGGALGDDELAPINVSTDGLRSQAAHGRRRDGGPVEAPDERTSEPESAESTEGAAAPAGEALASALESGELDGIRAEGTFHLGVREGEWSFFDPQGFARERGSYRGGKRDGAWLQYAPNGQLVQLAEYVDGTQEGAWQRYSREGALLEEGQFEASVQQGRWVRRYSNGSIKERGRYEAGLREGLWEFFDDLGRPTLRTGTYRAGIRIN
ncbi:hypothetical protein N9185_00085 [bacterium]|jgi:hypothetical protein|nr:hypothetical protein [bacterium]